MADGTPESNKSIATRLFIEVFDGHHLDAADTLLAPDVVFHNAGTDIQGTEAWKAFADGWLTGFPDLHVEIDFAMAEDDRVLLHWRAQGTNTGEFRGRPATGRRITASGMTLFRLANGRVHEMWDETAAFGDLETLRVS